jgi:hypothetical protein
VGLLTHRLFAIAVAGVAVVVGGCSTVVLEPFTLVEPEPPLGPVPLIVTGVGFEEFEGMTVHLRPAGFPESWQAPVAGGLVVVPLDDAWEPDLSPVLDLELYIDLEPDDLCTEGVDPAFMVSTLVHVDELSASADFGLDEAAPAPCAVFYEPTP